MSKRTRKIAKTIFFLCLTIFMLSYAVMTASFSAKERGADFLLRSDTVKKGRIFEIDIYARGTSLSSAIISLSYDESLISYRSINTYGNSEKRVYEQKGKTSFIYLCSEGCNISKETKIATVSFKANSEGKAKIDLSLSQCVDKELSDVDINSICGCTVNISQKGIKVVTDKKSLSLKTKGEEKAKDADSSDNKSYKESAKEKEKSTAEISVDKGLAPYFIGGAVVLFVVLIALFSYNIGKKANQNNSKN
ncbi:MAG: cohesin domain-containing protein [Acutalibacteraceae bacterium]